MNSQNSLSPRLVFRQVFEAFISSPLSLVITTVLPKIVAETAKAVPAGFHNAHKKTRPEPDFSFFVLDIKFE